MTPTNDVPRDTLSRRAAIAVAGLADAVVLGFGVTTRRVRAQEKSSSMNDKAEVERIYKLWDDALGAKDLEAALALYADDASIESPLVQHLLKTEKGVVQGTENLRSFIELVFQTSPAARKRFRTGYFTDGRVVIWEYPRTSPEGEQMDLVEVMEIEMGLIKRHKVYWGWYALNVLKQH